MQQLTNDSEMQEEFLYLNKGSHPYDWYVVPYKERNLNEYITFSHRVTIK